MSCLITNGRARGCKDSASGVFTFYIANYPEGVQVPSDYLTFDSDGAVSGLTGSTTGVSFYEFTPEKTSSDFTEEYNTSIEFGSVTYNQKVTIVMSGMNQIMQNQIKALLAGNFLVIVKMKSGKFFLLGMEDSMGISGGSAQSGKKGGELSGYSIELSAEEGTPAPEVDSAALTGHILANS